MGKAVALGLAARRRTEWRYALARRKSSRRAAEQIRKETGAEVVAATADVSVPAEVKKLLQKTVVELGKLDILVTNAGGPPFGYFLDLPEESWQQALEMNLLSTLHLCREAVPHMKAAGGGRIINITSFAAKQPQDGLILSNMARAGVLGLAKSLANELAPHNILVNTVCPGAIETERHFALAERRAAKEGVPVEKMLETRAKEIPLQRAGNRRSLRTLWFSWPPKGPPTLRAPLFRLTAELSAPCYRQQTQGQLHLEMSNHEPLTLSHQPGVSNND